jgi:tetratricopeptide (TPR) repeat protein
MYNLLLSIGLGVAGYFAGMLVARHWIAGFVPAILAMGIGYFLLARRSTRQLRKLLDQAGELLRKQRIDQARAVIESGRKLAHWQFLVGATVNAQLGMLAYIQRDFPKARSFLEKAFNRDWSAMGMLAALDFREARVDQAVKRLKKCEIFAKKEAVFWGLWAYIHVESKQRDEALAVLGRALAALPGSEALKQMQECVANRKKLRMKAFGDPWYAFFPEQIPLQRVNAAPNRGYPPPKR